LFKDDDKIVVPEGLTLKLVLQMRDVDGNKVTYDPEVHDINWEVEGDSSSFSTNGRGNTLELTAQTASKTVEVLAEVKTSDVTLPSKRLQIRSDEAENYNGDLRIMLTRFVELPWSLNGKSQIIRDPKPVPTEDGYYMGISSDGEPKIELDIDLEHEKLGGEVDFNPSRENVEWTSQPGGVTLNDEWRLSSEMAGPVTIEASWSGLSGNSISQHGNLRIFDDTSVQGINFAEIEQRDGRLSISPFDPANADADKLREHLASSSGREKWEAWPLGNIHSSSTRAKLQPGETRHYMFFQLRDDSVPEEVADWGWMWQAAYDVVTPPDITVEPLFNGDSVAVDLENGEVTWKRPGFSIYLIESAGYATLFWAAADYENPEQVELALNQVSSGAGASECKSFELHIKRDESTRKLQAPEYYGMTCEPVGNSDGDSTGFTRCRHGGKDKFEVCHELQGESTESPKISIELLGAKMQKKLTFAP
jgi:hypothetical protein